MSFGKSLEWLMRESLLRELYLPKSKAGRRQSILNNTNNPNKGVRTAASYRLTNFSYASTLHYNAQVARRDNSLRVWPAPHTDSYETRVKGRRTLTEAMSPCACVSWWNQCTIMEFCACIWSYLLIVIETKVDNGMRGQQLYMHGWHHRHYQWSRDGGDAPRRAQLVRFRRSAHTQSLAGEKCCKSPVHQSHTLQVDYLCLSSVCNMQELKI